MLSTQPVNSATVAGTMVVTVTVATKRVMEAQHELIQHMHSWIGANNSVAASHLITSHDIISYHITSCNTDTIPVLILVLILILVLVLVHNISHKYKIIILTPTAATSKL